MDAAALQRMLDEVFDQALVHHGFTGYLRDYEVIVHATADPRAGVQPAYLRYLFRHCVEARCEPSGSTFMRCGSRPAHSGSPCSSRTCG